jgi:aspartate carbamoyltransferase catalytic subunit
MGHLLRIEDLSQVEVRQVLARAEDLAAGEPARRRPPGVVGLMFLEPSLRTRVGFAAAAARLGFHTVAVTEPRLTARDFAESWDDTIRTASGYCDALVVRPGRPLSDPATLASVICPTINGGDAGPAAQHPSQALIDLFAMERLRGPIEALSIAIVGDVRMRAVRSLLSLLAECRPRRTVVISNPTYLAGNALAGLSWIETDYELTAAKSADVVYVAGMPHDSIDLASRRQLVVGEALLRDLADDAVILSPMPVLDEVEQNVRSDARIRFHEQSDLGMSVRMAILEYVMQRP